MAPQLRERRDCRRALGEPRKVRQRRRQRAVGRGRGGVLDQQFGGRVGLPVKCEVPGERQQVADRGAVERWRRIAQRPIAPGIGTQLQSTGDVLQQELHGVAQRTVPGGFLLPVRNPAQAPHEIDYAVGTAQQIRADELRQPVAERNRSDRSRQLLIDSAGVPRRDNLAQEAERDGAVTQPAQQPQCGADLGAAPARRLRPRVDEAARRGRANGRARPRTGRCVPTRPQRRQRTHRFRRRPGR